MCDTLGQDVSPRYQHVSPAPSARHSGAASTLVPHLQHVIPAKAGIQVCVRHDHVRVNR